LHSAVTSRRSEIHPGWFIAHSRQVCAITFGESRSVERSTRQQIHERGDP
jgi:hypothetical protein